MTDYTKLTEREINSKVADLRGLVIEYLTNKTIFVRCDNEDSQFRAYNPCNNPNDWLPLLEELRELGLIKINADDVFFRKYNESATIAVEADTLGKAICILWLMVKEVSNNEKL